jgi:hypothetical protein
MSLGLKISLRLLTIIELIILLLIALGKHEYDQLGIFFLLILLSPLIFYLISIQQRSILKKEFVKTSTINIWSKVLIVLNIIIILFFIITHLLHPLIFWNNQYVRFIPVEPIELYYYLNPLIGLLGIILIFLNWTLTNVTFKNSKKITTITLISLSLICTFLIIWINTHPPAFPEYHG